MLLINKTGFIINSADMIFHYRNIWEHLDKGSFDVILFKDKKKTFELIGNIYNCVDFNDVAEKNIKYKFLVSHQFLGYYEKDGVQEFIIRKIGLLNIRFMYALGKNAWNFSDWNNLYDLVLCYGPYHQEQFKVFPQLKTIAMGYPRYDDYFRKNIDIASVKRELNCSLDRKTVVYLPTYSSLSSIDLYAEKLSELSSSYNVIVKPHPGVISGEPARRELLKKLKFTSFIENSFDNLKLFAIADYVLCDYGGTMFGAIYLDKNLLLLNIPAASEDSNTGELSNDIQVRNRIINLNSADLQEIKSLLSNEKIWKDQQNVREDLRRLYFAPYYGFSSEITAQIIRNFDKILTKETAEYIDKEISCLTEQAEAMIENGNLKGAEELLVKALKDWGKHYKILNDLAAAEMLLGNFQQAEELYNDSLLLNKTDTVASENLRLLREMHHGKTNN